MMLWKKLISLTSVLSLLICWTVCQISPMGSSTDGTPNIRNTETVGTNKTEPITLPAYFADHMVIQRDAPISIWGYSDAEGAQVSVSLGDASASSAVSQGVWRVELEPMAAAQGLTLRISAPALEYEKELLSVDIGDLFLMSGQSNIAYKLSDMEGKGEYLALSRNLKNIRFFSQPRSSSVMEDKIGSGRWYDATSSNLSSGDVSAIGYVMATELATGLGDGVTVALLDAAFAGGMIQPFIDADTYRKSIVDSKHSYYSYATYLAFRSFFAKYGRMPTTPSQLQDHFEDSAAYYSLSDSEVENPHRLVSSVLYNSLISPIEGIRIKAVVWYQGEGNLLGADYVPFYQALTKSFRGAFCDSSLPFFVIQLAPYYHEQYASSVSDTKAAQLDMVSMDINSYLITANMEGFSFNLWDFLCGQNTESLIHPANKAPVGQRLGASVLKYLYGEDTHTVAMPMEVRATAGGIKIKFDSSLSLLWGDSLTGFEVSADGKSFYPAEATLLGDTVTLTCGQVPFPYYVRYGYSPMTFELKDGSRITVSTVIELDGEAVRLTTAEGDTVTLCQGQVVRGYTGGNLTNCSSAPVPAFKLAVGYER